MFVDMMLPHRLILQLTEEFLTLLAQSPVSANYFFIPPGLRINEVGLY